MNNYVEDINYVLDTIEEAKYERPLSPLEALIYDRLQIAMYKMIKGEEDE